MLIQSEVILQLFNHIGTVYYDVPAPKDSSTGNESAAAAAAARDDDSADAVEDGVVELLMNFSDRFATSRLFEIRVTQIPFSQRAPAGCMQYFTGTEGVIQVSKLCVEVLCGVLIEFCVRTCRRSTLRRTVGIWPTRTIGRAFDRRATCAAFSMSRVSIGLFELGRAARLVDCPDSWARRICWIR